MDGIVFELSFLTKSRFKVLINWVLQTKKRREEEEELVAETGLLGKMKVVKKWVGKSGRREKRNDVLWENQRNYFPGFIPKRISPVAIMKRCLSPTERPSISFIQLSNQ